MTNYKQMQEEARKICIEVRKEYHERMDNVLSEKLSDREEIYDFYLTGRTEISKEKFESILEEVKNQKVKENIFESWMRSLWYSGWNAKVLEEKIVFSRIVK